MMQPWYEYSRSDVDHCVGATEKVLDGALELRAHLDDEHVFDLVEMRSGQQSVACRGTLTEIGTFLDGARWATETQGRDAREALAIAL